MATTTTNYGLTKPSYGDNADIAVINSNMDKIDAKMKEIEDAGGGGGGGSSVSWNQLQTSGSKIAEVTIDGTKTDVYAPTGGSGGGSYSETVLYDYREDNGGNICYDTTTQTLRDDIENYDLLCLEFASSAGNLTNADWNSTNELMISVNSLSNGYNPNYISFTSFDDRSSRHYIKGKEFKTTIRNKGNTNGLIRMLGIKFSSNSGGDTGGNIYSTDETVIGTWIDGRPIYRKVFTTNSNDIDVTDLNIDVPIRFDAYGTFDGGYKLLITTGSASSSARQMYLKNNHIILEVNSFVTQHVVIEYVKTA